LPGGRRIFAVKPPRYSISEQNPFSFCKNSPTLPFGLFGLFQSLALAQAHARAAAVFVPTLK
jgi:hypothetical protein